MAELAYPVLILLVIAIALWALVMAVMIAVAHVKASREYQDQIRQSREEVLRLRSKQ